MDEHVSNNGAAMTANVQGFELPRGCLMTTGLILLPIITLLVVLVRAAI